VIWIDRDNGLPRRLEIHEQSGATRRLDLKRIRVNQTLPKSTFAFTVPEGARIVDQ
jgi:outer membrane lipoprotein-sorting protein